MKTTYNSGATPVQKTNDQAQEMPTETMDFFAALAEVVKGSKMHKLEWKDKNIYAMLVNQILKIHKADGKFYEWTLSYGDICGDDYVLI